MAALFDDFGSNFVSVPIFVALASSVPLEIEQCVCAADAVGGGLDAPSLK